MTHHVWCTDSCSVTCEKNKQNITQSHLCSLLYSTLQQLIWTSRSVSVFSTYGLRGVCIRIVSRVESSVCGQHGIKHCVAADHTVIYRREEEETTRNINKLNQVSLCGKKKKHTSALFR